MMPIVKKHIVPEWHIIRELFIGALMFNLFLSIEKDLARSATKGKDSHSMITSRWKNLIFLGVAGMALSVAHTMCAL